MKVIDKTLPTVEELESGDVFKFAESKIEDAIYICTDEGYYVDLKNGLLSSFSEGDKKAVKILKATLTIERE